MSCETRCLHQYKRYRQYRVGAVDAIQHSAVTRQQIADRFDKLLLKKTDLAKPNTYFHQLHPTDAAEIDARLADEKRKADEKAKAAAAAKAAAEVAKAAVPAAPDAKAPPAGGDSTKPFPM